MFAALAPLLTWLLRDVIVKFLVFSALLALLTLTAAWLLDQVKDMSPAGIKTAFSNLPASMKYFLVLFRVDVGLPMIFTAFLTRFIIRRLPVIG